MVIINNQAKEVAVKNKEIWDTGDAESVGLFG